MSEIQALLRRGGWTPSGEDLGDYDPFRDPPSARTLAERLAGLAREMSPDVVVAWESVEDSVLAFLVASHLQLPAVRAVNADGLVEFAGPLPDRPKAVLVGATFRRPEPVLAVATLLERMAGRLAGVVSLVEVTGEPLPAPSRALHTVSIATDEG